MTSSSTLTPPPIRASRAPYPAASIAVPRARNTGEARTRVKPPGNFTEDPHHQATLVCLEN